MKRYILTGMLAVIVAAIFVPAVWGAVFDMRLNQGPTSITDRYIGLSTDTKPTTLNVIGDTFREIDTGVVSVWDGDSWEPVLIAVSRLIVAGGDTMRIAEADSETVFIAGATKLVLTVPVHSVADSATIAVYKSPDGSTWVNAADLDTVTAAAVKQYSITDVDLNPHVKLTVTALSESDSVSVAPRIYRADVAR